MKHKRNGEKNRFCDFLWHKKIHLWYAVIQIYEVIAWEKAERDSTSVPLFAFDW